MTLKYYKGTAAGTYHHDKPVEEIVASRHARACGPPALKLLVQLATGRPLDVKSSASKRNELATSLARDGAGGAVAATYQAMTGPAYDPETGIGNAEVYHTAGEGMGEPGCTLVLELRDRRDGTKAMDDLLEAGVDVRIVA